MEKQQTALQQSIARKKERLKTVSDKFYEATPMTNDFIQFGSWKQLLEEEIAEDEKLLSVEREQMIRMHVSGQLHADRSKANRTYAEQHFNNTFKND
jgi:hypothetical protein